jgi:hypothetical protein
MHNEDFHIIVRKVKSRNLRWVGQVLRLEETRNSYGVWMENSCWNCYVLDWAGCGKKTWRRIYVFVSEHHVMKACGGWRKISTILDLWIRWTWVVSFTTRQLYPHSLDRRLPVWTLWSRKNSCPCRESTSAIQPVACCYTSWAIPVHIVAYLIYVYNNCGFWIRWTDLFNTHMS